MKPRVVINLVCFAVLGVVMTVWAFTSVIQLDAITRPYRVTAEFASSPGLVEKFDVAYLGVRVGRIGDVRLAPGKIIVDLNIDRNFRIPAGVTAEVRRKSAIGEPYVELTPPETIGPDVLAAGDVIPLGRTSVPIEYRKLFDGVGKLLNAVPPEDARTITHELATGLDGRAGSLRSIIDDAHDITDTVARNAATLDELATELTRLTGTLAGRRDKLAAGLSDLHAVTTSLRRTREDLNVFLDRGPRTFRQIDYLLHTARPGLSCVLTAGGSVHHVVFTPRNEAHIRHLLGIVPTALALADDITVVRPEGDYARATFIFSVPSGPRVAEEYRVPKDPPPVPGLRGCPEPPSTWKPPYENPPAAADPANPDGLLAEEPNCPTPQPVPTKAGTTTTATPTPPLASPEPHSGNLPLTIAIFAAVTLTGATIGWFAVGRRRQTP
ncbi:hypothetical protein Acor_16670 [Acrocarpospora corrugata]|uniref:Uncharacterized protein n=1 Tax=Acrocarpospora corrugata TaxID=35763 RepID=A0A5M3VSV9_9ACTN|nr:MCE family protein [Acrocarpospora corrugata]GER99603.1 hypothetical protein Acor_16670 [Acrocarpospora corrugata]